MALSESPKPGTIVAEGFDLLQVGGERLAQAPVTGL